MHAIAIMLNTRQLTSRSWQQRQAAATPFGSSRAFSGAIRPPAPLVSVDTDLSLAQRLFPLRLQQRFFRRSRRRYGDYLRPLLTPTWRACHPRPSLCLPAAYAHLCLSGQHRHPVAGPVAVAALLVAAAIAEHAPDYECTSDDLERLCLQVGMILLALYLLRMGGLVNLLITP